MKRVSTGYKAFVFGRSQISRQLIKVGVVVANNFDAKAGYRQAVTIFALFVKILTAVFLD